MDICVALLHWLIKLSSCGPSGKHLEHLDDLAMLIMGWETFGSDIEGDDAIMKFYIRH